MIKILKLGGWFFFALVAICIVTIGILFKRTLSKYDKARINSDDDYSYFL